MKKKKYKYKLLSVLFIWFRLSVTWPVRNDRGTRAVRFSDGCENKKETIPVAEKVYICTGGATRMGFYYYYFLFCFVHLGGPMAVKPWRLRIPVLRYYIVRRPPPPPTGFFLFLIFFTPPVHRFELFDWFISRHRRLAQDGRDGPIFYDTYPLVFDPGTVQNYRGRLP